MPITAPTKPRQRWITANRCSRWASLALFPSSNPECFGKIVARHYLFAATETRGALLRIDWAEAQRAISAVSEAELRYGVARRRDVTELGTIVRNSCSI
jgi:hypothetical protein